MDKKLADLLHEVVGSTLKDNRYGLQRVWDFDDIAGHGALIRGAMDLIQAFMPGRHKSFNVHPGLIQLHKRRLLCALPINACDPQHSRQVYIVQAYKTSGTFLHMTQSSLLCTICTELLSLLQLGSPTSQLSS